MEKERCDALEKTAKICKAISKKRRDEVEQAQVAVYQAEEVLHRAEQRSDMLKQYVRNRDATVLGTDQSNRLCCEQRDRRGLVKRDYDDSVVQKLLQQKEIAYQRSDYKSANSIADLLESIGNRRMNEAMYNALADGSHPIYQQAKALGLDIKPRIIDERHR